MLGLFVLWASVAYGQMAGQADISFQSYLLGDSHQPLYNTSGTAIDLKVFVPNLGLVHGAFEGYGGAGYAAGTNFLGLEQVPVLGWRGDFIGGDFQLAASPLKNPFTNIYTPDINGRGVRISLKRSDRSFQFFAGEETLLSGPRIPYRVGMPQLMVGGIAQQTLGRWQFGLRLIHLETDTQAVAAMTNLALPFRVFSASSNVAAQASYNFSKRWKFFSEAGYGVAAQSAAPSGTQQPLSLMLGSTWESGKLLLRGNYIRQSTTYLPLLGYFTGDRQGPFIEGQYRISPRFSLYGSASAYSNNLENNVKVPTFHSTGMNAGGSFVLPGKLNGSASFSTLDLTTRDPLNLSAPASSNRQINFSLSRQVQRHNIRFSVIDMKLNDALLGQRQRFFEIGDTFTWRRLTLSGAVRTQGSRSTESRNTMFYRGSIQANLKFVSVYANLESGNDLANRSIFSQNSYNTNVVGITTRSFRGWNLQFEGFRNTLNTTLNPQSVFLYSSSGSNSLEQTLLSSSGHWSAYFRLTKQVRWGHAMPAGSQIEQYALGRVPLVGAIRGLVLEQTLAGPRPAMNVAIILNQSRTAVTDTTGYYSFNEVPEGRHDVQLDMEKLSTDYEPGPGASANVIITPRAAIRRDFSVFRLASLSGRIVAPTGVAVDDVVIRLAGTQRYTTPEDNGNFFFHNLREGEYEVALDMPTLPVTVLLASAPAVKVVVSNTLAAEVRFELRLKPLEEKPVRKILEERIQVENSGVNRNSGSKPKSGLPNQSKGRPQPKGKAGAQTSAAGASANRPPNS